MGIFVKDKMKRRQTSHQLPFAGGFRLKSEKQQLIALGDLKEGSEKQWFTDFEDFGPIPRHGFQEFSRLLNTCTEFLIPSFIEVFQISFREFPRIEGRSCS